MHFLLIDFGASFIKSVVYDRESGQLSNLKITPSPFIQSDKIQLEEIGNLIKQVVEQYENVENVVMCSILGGYYVDQTYYSWKCSVKPPKPLQDTCLLSELFKDQSTYHVHVHHSKNSQVSGLQILGHLNNVTYYSSLGDTNCVIDSVQLNQDEVLINMGTGSQVVMTNALGGHDITSFIPSGRALNSFSRLFESLGTNLFEELKKLKTSDLLQSNMIFDLNIFPQSYKYKTGGSIANLNEQDLTKTNFISSLFRSYLDQYIEIIKNKNIKKIFLAGGISKKYSIVREYIQHASGIDTFVTSTKNEDTHIGMQQFINRFLN